MRKSWLIGGVIALSLMVLAGGIWLRRSRTPAPRPPVSAAQPEPAELTASGAIRAQQVVPVPIPVEGVIQNFFADVGEEVYEGELLAQIQSTALEAAREALQNELDRARSQAETLQSRLIAARLEAARARGDANRARAELERAEKVFLRQQLLFREGATPRLAYEKAEREFETAKATFAGLDEIARSAEEQVAALQKNLDEARKLVTQKTAELEEMTSQMAQGEVRAPAAGIVVARRGQTGETVRPDMGELFQIAVNLSQLEVALDLPPPDLERIRPGQEAAVIVAEMAGEALSGTVREVRDGQAIVEFVSPSPAVKPGLTVQVRIRLR
ncbi:MAG: efflux RND transporter periplasmic adaptor subunit [Bryobacterales bacterium]|nr:efflux RND transporter periplasmic adaptor subunit [Bryobacteraceae bacterium]MDW8353696.1 efflux RND transporter periplasmic adaptor subunit [Bryobacterales bacterium]